MWKLHNYCVFAYTKKIFSEIGGFGGISDKASGDDVFLLQKAVNTNKEKVHYLKNNDVIFWIPQTNIIKLG